MKKIFMFLVCMSLAFYMLSGCSNREKDDENNPSPSPIIIVDNNRDAMDIIEEAIREKLKN